MEISRIRNGFTLSSCIDNLDEAFLVTYFCGFPVCIFNRRIVGLLIWGSKIGVRTKAEANRKAEASRISFTILQ